MDVWSPIKIFQNGQRENTKVPESVITPAEAMLPRPSEVLIVQQYSVSDTCKLQKHFHNPKTIIWQLQHSEPYLYRFPIKKNALCSHPCVLKRLTG